MLSNLMELAGGILAQGAAGEWLRSAGSLLLVMLGFSFVVFVHELGHFLAAKWAGVRVERFAIGFGQELFGFQYGETRYSFNVLPLGGYVKMLGQEDFAVDKTGELKVKSDDASFTNKPVGQRMVIVSAGVVMNLIFAAIGLTIYMMIGYNTAPPVVGMVAPATPAARAGIQPGDKILGINGYAVREFTDVRMRIVLSDPGEVLTFDVEREGKRVEPSPRVLPEFQEDERVRQVGMSPGWTRTVAIRAGSPSDEYGESELRPNDLILAIIRDGRSSPVRSMGEVWTAMMDARGGPLQLEVKRPDHVPDVADLVNPEDENRQGRILRVTVSAGWYVHPEDIADGGTTSLLGLVPRLRGGAAEERSPADLAGVESNDVICRFGSLSDPSFGEFGKLVWQYENRDVPLVVRRPRSSHGKFSAAAVQFLCSRREAWIEAAVTSPETARTLFDADLTASGLPEVQTNLLRGRSRQLATAESWLNWLESVDQHTLTIRPTRPFVLTGGAKPRIGLPLDLPEDDRLVVADILPQVGSRQSPAARSGIPRGAVILACDGRSVDTWPALTEQFRASAGRNVRLRYRAGLTYSEADFEIPGCISSALALSPSARITSINGQERAEVLRRNGQPQTLYLPDWRAVAGLLRQNTGKTVKVNWSGADEAPHEAEFAVTDANVDPWLMRVAYVPTIFCYPMMVEIRESSPIAAAWQGIRKTYFATWNTLQSIRHIAFTQQVGVNQLKGPVGIARMGMQIAESSGTQLLWFMCLISANLAVINFLPLPIVDGGLFFFLVLEKIRGEPLSIRTQVVTQILGMALIASVFLFVTFQDIVNWNK